MTVTVATGNEFLTYTGKWRVEVKRGYLRIESELDTVVFKNWDYYKVERTLEDVGAVV